MNQWRKGKKTSDITDSDQLRSNKEISKKPQQICQQFTSQWKKYHKKTGEIKPSSVMICVHGACRRVDQLVTNQTECLKNFKALQVKLPADLSSRQCHARYTNSLNLAQPESNKWNSSPLSGLSTRPHLQSTQMQYFHYLAETGCVHSYSQGMLCFQFPS